VHLLKASPDVMSKSKGFTKSSIDHIPGLQTRGEGEGSQSAHVHMKRKKRMLTLSNFHVVYTAWTSLAPIMTTRTRP
jgi:hypothetical protein